MVHNARVRLRRTFREPARRRRLRHATLAPSPAAPSEDLHPCDPDEWGAAAVELGLVPWPAGTAAAADVRGAASEAPRGSE